MHVRGFFKVSILCKNSQKASSYKFLIMIFGRPFLLLFQAPSSLDSSLRYLSHLLYSRLVEARKTYDSLPTDRTSNASFSSGTKINEICCFGTTSLLRSLHYEVDL